MGDERAARLSGHALAVRAERIDADNWIDDFSQAPPHVTKALGLQACREGELVMVRSHIPFNHFNMVMTLGCPAAVDDPTFEAIERFYSEGGVERHWIVLNDFSQPPGLAQQLVARGYEPAGAWERVVLQGVTDDEWAEHAQGCELVTPANAEEWSRFVMDCYRMPPLIGEWLRALAGSRGWLHAMRREGGHADGKVIMARSLYQDAEGWAWLGIDAPVPGVMAPCFEDDQKVVATLLAHAATRGARAFVSDIEVPCPTRDSEAYRRWGQLGFTAVYLRKLFSKSQRA